MDIHRLASEVARRTRLLAEAATTIVANTNSHFQAEHQDTQGHQDVSERNCQSREDRHKPGRSIGGTTKLWRLGESRN